VYEKAYLSTAGVALAGHDLRDALANPDRLDTAVAQLVGAGERSIALFDETAVQAFDHAGVPEAGPAPSADELVTGALGQLSVANTMFAASRAVGEYGEPEPAELDRSLLALDDTVSVLREDRVRPAEPAVTPGTGSSGARFVEQLRATLDAVTARSAEIVVQSVVGIGSGGPDALRKAWNWATEAVHLDEIGGKLTRLGLRALHGALGVLAKVFPSARMAELRADLHRLIEESKDGAVLPSVLGTVLGVPGPVRDAERTLRATGSAGTALAAATEELVRLDARHDEQMRVWNAIGTAIGVARSVTTVVKIAVPYLGVLILGAHLLVLGAVVTIGRGYVAEAGTIVDAVNDTTVDAVKG
jgi:hypothetical protein